MKAGTIAEKLRRGWDPARSRLDDKDVQALIKGRPAMPGWMGDVVLRIWAAHSMIS